MSAKLAFFLSALSLIPSAEAFIFIRGGSYGKGERPVSSAPIWPTRVAKFYVNTDLTAYGGSNPPEVTGSEFFATVESSVNAWAASCRSDLQVQIVGTTTAYDDPDDQLNVIAYDNRTDIEGNLFQDDTILAAATSALRGTEFFDCDIVVNGNSLNDFAVGDATAVSGKIDLQSVLTHEIGHCLGLDHPIESGNYTSANSFLNESSLVQSADIAGGEDSIIRRDINQDDRDAIDCIYERGLPFRAGTRCSSYHGTSGGGAISGVVSGGPSADLSGVCGSNGDARTAMPSEEGAGMGCVGNAFAGTTRAPGSSTGFPWAVLWSPWLWIAIAVLGRFGWNSIGRTTKGISE